MTLKHLFYADSYTSKIADKIGQHNNAKAKFFKLHNPTFHRWTSWLGKLRLNKNLEQLLPPSSILIGGNRWRHHYALNLTNLPMVSLDGHTDMSYDEMIPLRLIRPYNWLYFRLLEGLETHLVLPYSNFKGGRWNIVVPVKYVDRFHLYSFDRKRSSTNVCLSVMRSRNVEIKDVETILPMPNVNKQISLDWDITREVQEARVERLVARIAGEGDVCDIWLDEGKRGRRNTMQDHIRYCSRIYDILNNA